MSTEPAGNGRPRCRHIRPHEVRTVKTVKGKLVATTRIERECGYLLDADGRCWFCRHIDRQIHKQALLEKKGVKHDQR